MQGEHPQELQGTLTFCKKLVAMYIVSTVHSVQRKCVFTVQCKECTTVYDLWCVGRGKCHADPVIP